jgi:hypothetical protein
MTPAELAAMAVKNLNAGLSRVQLVIPRRAGGGRRVRVFGGRPSLFGELCCENAEGKAVVWVDALSLLAWMTARGLIDAIGPDGQSIKAGGAA